MTRQTHGRRKGQGLAEALGGKKLLQAGRGATRDDLNPRSLGHPGPGRRGGVKKARQVGGAAVVLRSPEWQ